MALAVSRIACILMPRSREATNTEMNMRVVFSMMSGMASRRLSDALGPSASTGPREQYSMPSLSQLSSSRRARSNASSAEPEGTLSLIGCVATRTVCTSMLAASQALRAACRKSATRRKR